MYSYFEEAFNKGFYKILIEINVFSTYFCLINVSNIFLKHFVNVLIYAILINVNISTIYLSNIIIIYSN